MSLGKPSRLAFALLTVLAGCSSGSSGGSNSIGTAVQDLTGDPEGTITRDGAAPEPDAWVDLPAFV